jgi:O-antigen biosynthesis protein
LRPLALRPMRSYEAQVATHWENVDMTEVRSFWQSPVVMAALNERITGRPGLDRLEYFAARYGPFHRAVSLGSGHGHVERRLAQLGIVRQVVGVDLSEARLGQAREKLPAELADRVTYHCANLETWEPEGTFDLLVCKSVLHHIAGLERWMELVGAQPACTVYVDDFVGPARFQWTDRQLEAINRLLQVLPDEYKRNLTAEGTVRRRVGRPDVQRFIANDPSEAIRSDEIVDVLDRYLRRVEVKPYGGAIYHQLFSRTMGNFEDNPALVRVIVEMDLLLTDLGVLDPNYVWGVWAH